MITTKQRAVLRGLANTIDTISQIGKGGVGENLLKQADDALTARELIKIRVLPSCELSPKDAAEQLSSKLRADVVQVIGGKFVLYRRNHEKSKIGI